MKKTLKLGKRTITQLDKSFAARVMGGIRMEEGLRIFTSGCTDGCSPAFTYFNCTLTHFTGDCASAEHTHSKC